MVTSTKTADDKVVTMSADADMEDSPPPAPPRTLLEDVNAHLTCFLCRGYYIDATTIVECLHSFCRSCIVKHLQTNTYCPVCEMMINTAKPNIKPDKALQDIVYKLVPGLFQSEMDRRRKFYSSRPGPAASATPEQRGEDTERIIFSPLDVISFSLEYAEVTDAESVSSRSSESGNEAPSAAQQTRRYLQCPAVVNISHLKKFISMKFDIDCSQYCIDILYKRVPLLDYYTLMDIAYIYNWKRNEPMRFFYQILDYSAIRNRFRLFDINRKGSHFRDRKQSPADAEDSHPLNDHSSEGTSGTNSPMPDDCNTFVSSKCNDKAKLERNIFQAKVSTNAANTTPKSDSNEPILGKDEIEKSEFLNSFHLTPKNSSPTKSEPQQTADKLKTDSTRNSKSPQKLDDGQQKRKVPSSEDNSDPKKQKIEVPNHSVGTTRPSATTSSTTPTPTPLAKMQTNVMKKPDEVKKTHPAQPATALPMAAPPLGTSVKLSVTNQSDQSKLPPKSLGGPDNTLKRPLPTPQNAQSPKRKTTMDQVSRGYTSQSSTINPPSVPTSALHEPQKQIPKQVEPTKPPIKKLPDLKLTIPNSALNKNKQLPPNINRGMRSDLLANNSDPIQDRTKILSQVKKGMNVQSPGDNKNQGNGDPLKSLLFDSCKINIPSSLSITLTDQKAESGNGTDANKNTPNKNSSISGPSNFSNMKSPTPAVQNSIEIVKLPDVEQSKPTRPEVQNAVAASQPVKTTETTTPTTSKGPMPSLKPISESKIGKQTYSKPSPTFHQIFIQSLQNQQADKTKLPKTKPPLPKLMPANSKLSNEPNKSDSQINTKCQSENKTVPPAKSDNVLDLSSPSQLGPHQKTLLETMQSIANLAAKKQNMPQKLSSATSGSSFNQNMNKPVTNILPSLRMPSQLNQKQQKPMSPSPNVSRMDSLQTNKANLFRPLNPTSSSSSVTNTSPQSIATPAQSSPRSQTRSPSVSPKLVIAEDKQPLQGQDGNQSNLISSSQNSSTNPNSGAHSVSQPKPLKVPKQQMPPTSKPMNARMPSSISKPSSSLPNVASAEMLHASQLFAQQQAFQQAIQARHLEMNLISQMSTSAEWINKLNQARIENLYKSFSNVQQAQNEFNSNKDNKK